jgi:hypothetical protein
MEEDFLVLVYVCLEEMLQLWGHQSHALAEVADAGVLSVAVVASKHFRGKQEIALSVMKGMGYIRGRLDISRFNRRMHALARHRHQIETLGSQLENISIQHIRASTNKGFFLKVHPALLVLLFTNF